MQDG